MTTTDSNGPLSRLKAWQERVRAGAAYVALVVVLVVLYFGAFLGPLKNFLLPGALTLVAAFVVQTLQSIERNISGTEASESFPDMTSACSRLEELVARDRDVTSIKIIAATGGTTVSHVLPRLIKRSPAKHVQITLQVIDREGPFCEALPGHWCDEVGTTLTRLRQQFADPRLSLTVSTYGHLPAFHGILIDDRHLLLGFFGWDTSGREPELTGAQRPHRLYRRGDPAAIQLFEAFDEWFRHAPQRAVLTLSDRTADIPAVPS